MNKELVALTWSRGSGRGVSVGVAVSFFVVDDEARQLK